ncbi:MAG: hypothetical protein JWN18_599 [Parcubacteria group bacterium]|nr:hypothetical protein [Parcubacteria group bacterium]
MSSEEVVPIVVALFVAHREGRFLVGLDDRSDDDVKVGNARPLLVVGPHDLEMLAHLRRIGASDRVVNPLRF